MLKYYLPIVILCCFCTVAKSQTDTVADSFAISAYEDSLIADTHLLWATAGVGAYGAGVGLLFKLTYSWGNKNICAKVVSSGSLKFSGGDEQKEVSLLYGYQQFTRGILGRIAAGPAYIPDALQSNKKISGVGVGGEAEIIFKASPVGIGVMISALFATHSLSSYGLTLNVHFGKL